jgi:sigma-E processing peptidase SpoIIGA
MDFLCFFLVARLLSIKESLPRSIAASAIGGVYACVSLIVSLGALVSLIVDVLVAVVMSAVAFGRKKELLRIFTYSVVYAAVSIVLGGAMTALFEIFNRIGLDRMLGSEEDADGISIWLFALLAFLGGLFTLFGARRFKRRSAAVKCRVRFTYKGKSIEIDGLCDSGNLLREPISAKPCIVVAVNAIGELLEPAFLRAVSEQNTEKLCCQDASRVRVVFMNTASGGGMSYAVRMDKIELDMGNGMSEVDAFVVLSAAPIRAKGADALVPSELCLMR